MRELPRPSGFFVLRTPLLPFEDFRAWTAGLEAPALVDDPSLLEPALARDRARQRARLRDVFSRPDVREALFVASPDLEARHLDGLVDAPDDKAQKIELALSRYFARMCARATPFGLFAGHSVGRIDGPTRLVLESRDGYCRHTRLDNDYLTTLAEKVEEHPQVRAVLRYRPNSSLYELAGRLRYTEARLAGHSRAYHLVTVAGSDHLRATLECARRGASVQELAAALVDSAEVSHEEAQEFVEELVRCQILVSDLAPGVTGAEPLASLVGALDPCPEGARFAQPLNAVAQALADLDGAGLGNEPARYREVARMLEELPAPAQLSRLFQVDMFNRAPELTLDPATADEMARGARVLHRLRQGMVQDGLARLRRAFTERFQGRTVPLVEALDEESGMRLDSGSVAVSPLLEGLALARTGEAQQVPWGPVERLLSTKLAQALWLRSTEIAFDEAEIEGLATAHLLPLPEAFSITATLCASGRIVFGNLLGPSGCRMLGRFCHADERLGQCVAEHLRAEEALAPQAIFAEIAHLPEGRMANVMLRPVLRGFEIPFLGRPGVAPEQQISVTDLDLSVEADRFVLRSRRLGCEVLPRMTNAHNFTGNSVPLYRFLGLLQGQGTASLLLWNWGPFEGAPFLPRVSCGRVVLTPALWNVSREQLRHAEAGTAADRYRACRELRTTWGIPRLVRFAEWDNQLLLDLDSATGVEMLFDFLRRTERVTLLEMYPAPEDLCATGPEGHFVHELVVPFLAPRATPATTASARPVETSVRRVFAPGSEWLYAKLYASPWAVDELLREVVEPLTRDAQASGASDLWHFLRYEDPEWHLRLRLRGDPARLMTEVVPRLAQALEPHLASGLVQRWQLDTYDREVERYGGDRGIVLAEKLFHADSVAVLEILTSIAGDEGADLRWRLALCGIDSLLESLGLDRAAKRRVVGGLRAGMAQEFKMGKALKVGLGDKFRSERRALEPLVDPSGDDASPPLAAARAAFGERAARLADVVAELKTLESGTSVERLAGSFVHMHVNRLLRSDQRAQELVLYDFLERLYESQSSRVLVDRRAPVGAG